MAARTVEELDEQLVVHARKLGEHDVKHLRHDERITVVEERSRSYATAELAYRQATEASDRQRDEHKNEHTNMLSSAKKILEGSTAAAVAPFAPALATVADIRAAQEARHKAEEISREIRTRAAWFGAKAVATCSALLTAAKLYQMLTGH